MTRLVFSDCACAGGEKLIRKKLKMTKDASRHEHLKSRVEWPALGAPAPLAAWSASNIDDNDTGTAFPIGATPCLKSR